MNLRVHGVLCVLICVAASTAGQTTTTTSTTPTLSTSERVDSPWLPDTYLFGIPVPYYVFDTIERIPTGHVACFHVNKQLQPVCQHPKLEQTNRVVFNRITTDVQMVDIRRQEDDIVKRYRKKTGAAKFVCTSKDDKDIEVEFIKVHNRLPFERVFDILSTEEFYANPPVDYDERFIVQPSQNWWREFCKKHDGMELRSEIYGTLNELLLEYLQHFQVEQQTGIEILQVEFAQPTFDAAAELEMKNIASHGARYKSQQGQQLIELLNHNTTLAKQLANQTAELEKQLANARMEQQKTAIDNQRRLDAAQAEAEVARIQLSTTRAQAMLEVDVNEAMVNRVFNGSVELFVTDRASVASAIRNSNDTHLFVGHNTQLPQGYSGYYPRSDTPTPRHSSTTSHTTENNDYPEPYRV